ncbi:electron transfer flavoprotein subunit beta/FixA family protein [Nitrospirillum sp. BR 11828]|uniref:electron transfer flavoprotein subunit beta/FixA family protein n=1 Tax=Nitrospirillum sp. BR 11828 TaxID=3104325 RepID=UPI002ACA406A|nr:electron transfer flavoprotein subunit beta/FixA family protein [Nitrospirillum sp. BR 11828]MDZ5649905.1 electron transfer flavoprotein subunit beta/FixA family protein [Nitrospirillum sp. BR 11828]
MTVLTMGPPMAEDSLRKALTYGADRAVLLTDRAFAGSDTLATSFALAAALDKVGREFGVPPIVFTGKQTIDGDTAQVGPGIAKRLGLNQLTYVARIADLDPAAGTITVERRAEGGLQVLQTRLPVLITMLEGVNEIRRGSLDDAYRAARAQVVRWSAADAGITDLASCGLKGSPTIVKKVFAPQGRAEPVRQVPTIDRSADELAADVMAAIFQTQPALEEDLLRFAAGQ